jgi:phosphomannomutase
MAFQANPIKFGTDGWRGVIAADFTFERVTQLAPLSAYVLQQECLNSNLIIVGYDRRFLAEEFARTTAEVLQDAGFDVLLAQSYAPTPAFSWAAKEKNALGAFVLTASHNPPEYLGFKIKGGFGGSVTEEITQKIEALFDSPLIISDQKGSLNLFDPWESYCHQLRSQVDIESIKNAIVTGKLNLFVDVMHGAASTGLSRLLSCDIPEINSNRDPLFGGNPPEPLAKYIPELFRQIKASAKNDPNTLRLGLVFDGDCDRIASVDSNGEFCSTQVLIPILIEHLIIRKKLQGEIVKTVSGSDLIPKIAQLFNQPLYETPIGYKYIAERMREKNVLIGGEESGGVGYINHIPERDALLSALYVLEAIVQSGKSITELHNNLQQQVNFTSAYDRIDLKLKNLEQKQQLEQKLQQESLTEIAEKKVIDCLAIDGYKYRLEDDSWLLIRFSGTEPLLRLYSEGLDINAVQNNLNWAKNWALT